MTFVPKEKLYLRKDKAWVTAGEENATALKSALLDALSVTVIFSFQNVSFYIGRVIDTNSRAAVNSSSRLSRMSESATSSQNGETVHLFDKGIESFGPWVNDLERLNKEFVNARPFPNVEIDNFFKPEIAEALYAVFPKVTDEHKWVVYNNPIEKKYALTDFSSLSQFKELFAVLQTKEFVDLVKQISGIDNLESDPHLHGAGLHQHIPGGKLDMHLDYSLHPVTGKERRVNLIIYFTKDWKEEYGGAIELWNEDFSRCEKKVSPCFNKAILFRTSDVSYHGLPLPVKCPEGNSRKSIAIYYVSDPRPDLTNIRYKAQFRPLPTQPVNEKLEQLYRIREKRIITKEDLESIYPDWHTDGNGHW